MGVLSDLVVAPETDAQRVAEALVPSKAFGGIDIKGIDTVKFATLHAIVTKRTFEDVLPEYDPAVQVSDEGPWVTRIPPELVAALAALTADERDRVAAVWAKTDEFRLDRWDVGHVAAGLDAICRLAKKATGAGQALFLWMSL